MSTFASDCLIDLDVWNYLKLKSITYDFFNEFFYSVKKDNWSKEFGGIIWFLVEFWNDDKHEYFEMGRLVT